MNRTEDPQDIARDIRETRSDMSETVDALADKLDPNRLKDQATDAISTAASDLVDHARDAFTTSARDAGSSLVDQVRDSSVLDTVKDNPLPALAVGLSVAWFVSKLGESETERYRRDRYAATGDPYYAPRSYRGARTFRDVDLETYREPYRMSGTPASTGDGGAHDPSLADQASDALGAAKDKAGDLVDAVKDTASDAADAVKDTTSGLTHKAGDHLDHGRQRVDEARRSSASWMDQQMHQNPLLVGSVALATGALVGLSLPETQAENEAFGAQADRVKSQALDAAETAASDVTERASEVVEDAKTAAKDVAETAKTEAKDVAKTAKTKAKTAADSASSAASSVASTAKAEAGKATSSKTASAKAKPPTARTTAASTTKKTAEAKTSSKSSTKTSGRATRPKTGSSTS